MIDGVHHDNPVPEFAGGQLIPYVWNNTRGNEDLCNRFANIGYPVVLCSVTNLYWDLAYNKDPLEPGLTWAGFVDARHPFEFVPEDVFKSTRVNAYGHQYDRAQMYAEREQLTEDGLRNVLGIQGQIWCETIKGPQMLEYYAFPKMLGMAERAWAAQPDWATISDLEQHDAAVQDAWNEFANRLGQRELPRLDWLFGGIAYRLPPPGRCHWRRQTARQQRVSGPDDPLLHRRQRSDGIFARLYRTGRRIRPGQSQHLRHPQPPQPRDCARVKGKTGGNGENRGSSRRSILDGSFSLNAIWLDLKDLMSAHAPTI